MKKIFFTTLLLFVSLLPNQSHAAYDEFCGIGANRNASYGCDPFWMDWSTNDGFNKSTTFIVQTADADYISGFRVHYYLELSCIKRQLSVAVYSLDFGMYPDANLYSNGSGQVKFDNSKPRNFNYKRTRDLESLVLSDPKSFIRSFIKSNSSVSFKIPTLDGYSIPTFLKLDFNQYAKQLKRAGCNF